MEQLAMDYMQKISKRKYSIMEGDLLRLLPKKGGRISSVQLVKLYYGNNKPYHAQQSVSKMMRELIKKVDLNKEPFKIIKTKPSGPHPSWYAKVDR